METRGQALAALPSGVFKTLCKVRPMGALQARRQATGAIAFYWRYSIGDKSERVLIGLYDSKAPPKSLTPTRSGFSYLAAVDAAESLAKEHHQHRDEGGRPALQEAKRLEKEAAEQAKRRAAANTLKALLLAYCDHLQAMGRRSHRDARSIFSLHVFEPWPEIAALPAKDVQPEQFADMMRRLLEAGKGRTANKLRSYARAAYQTARAAKSKPNIPVLFKAFEVASNPVADTAPDEAQNKPDKRPLTEAELRAYWASIKALDGFKGALLRLHLLTGGQRIEQFVNVKTADLLADAIVLHDGKGRPGRPPRPHTVPLIRAAAKALKECAPSGTFAFSTDGGETHVAATTLSEWAVDAAAGIEGFQAKRIRSGVETLLAASGVPSEIRGRLQSHGVAGVQARHYDGHDYMHEKASALETLWARLAANPARKVLAFKRRAA